MQAFDDGDYYPIWGTCRGLQQLLSLVDGTDVTTATGVMDKSLPLNFTEGKPFTVNNDKPICYNLVCLVIRFRVNWSFAT